MIRLAKIKEIPKIFEIPLVCINDMINRTIFQWNENYPTEKIIFFKTK